MKARNSGRRDSPSLLFIGALAALGSARVRVNMFTLTHTHTHSTLNIKNAAAIARGVGFQLVRIMQAEGFCGASIASICMRAGSSLTSVTGPTAARLVSFRYTGEENVSYAGTYYWQHTACG